MAAESTGRERVRVRVRVRRRRSGRGSRRRRLKIAGLLVLGGLGLFLAADAAWVATTASRELSSVRDLMTRGAEALEAGRLDEAESSFRLASARAEHAGGALAHPAAAIARALPLIGDDVDAARHVAEAAGHAARAGSFAVAAAIAVGWDGQGLSGGGAGRIVDPDGVARAAPDLSRARAQLDLARESLAGVEVGSLFGSLREGVLDARRELETRTDTMDAAATLAAILPSMLGADEARTYLVIVQNLSDPRGSGGHPGAYGVVEVEDGSVGLREFAPITTLGTVPPIEAPPEVVNRYEVFGARTTFIATTYPPEFPTSARLLLEMWTSSGRPPPDGIVSIDPVWMSYLLAATGPVTVSTWPDPLSADNVTDVLLRQTFLSASQMRSNRLQSAIGGELFGTLVRGLSASREVADAFARAARERHLQVYATDPEEQAALESLDVAGRIAPSPNRLLVTWFGAGASRAGYFAEKEISYEATLDEDGSAEVTVSATLINRAPAGPPSILLGGLDPRDVPTGHWDMFVNVYLPPGAEVVGIRGGSLEIVQAELGGPVVLGLIGAASGGSDTFTVTYRLPSIVSAKGDVSEFALDLAPQPALRPDRVTVTVALPEGASVVGTSGGVRIDDGVATWEGSPAEPLRLGVTFTR
jgi:hypothetical protein